MDLIEKVTKNQQNIDSNYNNSKIIENNNYNNSKIMTNQSEIKNTSPENSII